MNNQEDKVLIEDTYNREGYLIKRVANGIPMFVPKQDFPQVQIFIPDVEWITEKVFMTKEEAKHKFPDLDILKANLNEK